MRFFRLIGRGKLDGSRRVRSLNRGSAVLGSARIRLLAAARQDRNGRAAGFGSLIWLAFAGRAPAKTSTPAIHQNHQVLCGQLRSPTSLADRFQVNRTANPHRSQTAISARKGILGGSRLNKLSVVPPRDPSAEAPITWGGVVRTAGVGSPLCEMVSRAPTCSSTTRLRLVSCIGIWGSVKASAALIHAARNKSDDNGSSASRDMGSASAGPLPCCTRTTRASRSKTARRSLRRPSFGCCSNTRGRRP